MTGLWFLPVDQISTESASNHSTRKTALLAYNILYYFGSKSNVVKKPIIFFHPVIFLPML